MSLPISRSRERERDREQASEMEMERGPERDPSMALKPALEACFAACAIPARYALILDGLREAEAEADLSPSLRKRVVETVLACAAVELHMDAICILCSETERVKAISRVCGINAEPGFCEGSTPEAVRSVVESRLSTLCNAFQVSRATGNLLAFFKGAFRGDPCLNGRLVAIQRFAFEQETGLSADLLTHQDAFTDHDDIAFKFTELMYGLSFEQAPSKAEFEQYLRQQADFETLYKPWVESPCSLSCMAAPESSSPDDLEEEAARIIARMRENCLDHRPCLSLIEDNRRFHYMQDGWCFCGDF